MTGNEDRQMNDMAALETRMAQALDRIRAGIAAQAGATGAGDLQAQLAEEQSANAQLQERVKALKDRQDGRIAELEAKVVQQRTALSAQDGQLEQMRAAHADLTAMVAQLTKAATEGATDPDLINRALMAEVDALRTQRSAEAAEIATILAELKPLVEEN
jgi:chromosome segregation ATPase